jgi:serine/threonine protein phosphatase 1
VIQQIFAVGDPHGCLDKLELLLQSWNPDSQKLVILGDLIDRGTDSIGVIHTCMKLQNEYGAVILGGNHEEMFLDWLGNPTDYATLYLKQGGRETIKSFFDGQNHADKYLPWKIAEMMNEKFIEEIRFLRGLPDYYESGEHVFVHAGVDLTKDNWKDTKKEDFRWIREEFHYGKNNTGKTFVFGHTLTCHLNENQTCAPWVAPCQSKIGIDGGAVFKGYLLGLQIEEDGYNVYAA